MARRRLAPAMPGLRTDPDGAHGPRTGADVARAEHLPDPARPGRAAPIARVAADAAGSAALQEMSDALMRAREDWRMVLDLALNEIAPDHLMRDRLPAEDAEMAGLRESLRAHGQRMPVEVAPIEGPLPYGLISGWRRLTALKALHAETNDPRFATIRALVSRPESAAAAYVRMVEENEIRAGLSQYERARVAARAVARGVFETEKAALLALFANVSRAKRSRIRSFLEIYHALDGSLRFPASLPERLGLRLVARLRAGEGAAVAAALAQACPQTPEAEQVVLEAWIAGGRTPRRAASGKAAGKVADGAAPRHAVRIGPGLTCETRLEDGSLTLRLTGSKVGHALETELLALLCRACGGSAGEA